ncbi:hypothetical protein KCU64_g101, partial [Aureobasidium melanogenum]
MQTELRGSDSETNGQDETVYALLPGAQLIFFNLLNLFNTNINTSFHLGDDFDVFHLVRVPPVDWLGKGVAFSASTRLDHDIALPSITCFPKTTTTFSRNIKCDHNHRSSITTILIRLISISSIIWTEHLTFRVFLTSRAPHPPCLYHKRTVQPLNAQHGTPGAPIALAAHQTAARVVLQTPELLHLILASFIDFGDIRQQRAALALAARVCKLWSNQVALLLWRLNGRPDYVRRHVCASKQAVVASYMRRATLFFGEQLWDGSPLYMPSFSNVNDIYVISNSSDFSSQAVYLPKLLHSRIEELSFKVIPDQVIDSAANSDIPSPAAHLPWLRAVEQRCTNLSSLELNMRLPPSAVTDLGRLLLGTSLKKLYLGPLLDEVLDDFTVALVLAQQSMEDLTINYPITMEALEILDQQCGGRPIFNHLQYLQMHCTSHAAEVLTLLLSLTPHLRLFYLTIYPSDTEKPWIETPKTPRSPSGVLTSWPLPDTNNMLLIREISAAEVMYLMRNWQLLEPESTLNLWIERLPCTMAQAQIMWQLYGTIKDLNFSIRYFIIDEEPELHPEVWLPSNNNFSPDPMEWQHRQLYNPGAEVARVQAVKDDDEDEYFVWGHEEPKHKRYDRSLSLLR